MRTPIPIADVRVSAAMNASGATMKREVVTLGLPLVVQMHARAQIGRLRGTLVSWTGDGAT